MNENKQPANLAATPIRRDWKQLVAASGGAAVFLPESFKTRADDIEALRTSFNELIKKVAEREIELNMATQNMFYELRQYLAKNGRDDVWTKEIGFDASALRDGEYVINLREHQR